MPNIHMNSPYLRENTKEKVVRFFLFVFFDDHMPHLKTKLKITFPSWKFLFISLSKLVYSKTNLSSCKT